MANQPPGAVPTNGASNDPFVNTPPHAHPAIMRYSSFDNDQISSYSNNSPAQAKRALEAHLKDTERRIQDASKLGVTLVQQRKNLAARLRELEEIDKENEVPVELKQKLADLEKEYNEVGKESARAFLPKLRSSASESLTPSVFSAQGGVSPSKVSAPSRRQRNQPSNRVHDIEFATEISTSLLAQVRQLQSALAEKDQAHKDLLSEKAQLEADAASLALRIKQMDETTQIYKDENWNLETKVQELETSLRESQDKEQRLGHTLKTTHSERAAAQRDLDDLKVSHEKAIEEHHLVRRQQETDLHGLRRDVAGHETEKQTLRKKVEELTVQNTELAKAVSYRWNRPHEANPTAAVSAGSEDEFDDADFGPSEPTSPIKGTPARAGMLESETLKSSLNHAHRMIQNLKNNIHREKTEKVELRRMLNETRDELERNRGDGAAGAAKKRRSEPDGVKFRRPNKPNNLGANRSSTIEIMEDEPDWEDHDGPATPSRSRSAGAAVAGAALGGAATYAYSGHETETSDAFETADERRGETATETEAFQTGLESMDDDSDDMTETEDNVQHGSISRRPQTLLAHRQSYMSTASASGDEEESEIVRTPVQTQGPKYRVRLSRGPRQSDRSSQLFSDSPSSSNGTPRPTGGMSLGDELDALDDDSTEDTPSRHADSAIATPETQRYASVDPETPSRGVSEEGDDTIVEASHDPEIGSPIASAQSPKPEGEGAVLAHQANAAMLAHEFAIRKPVMVDAGIMTEPWEPEKQIVIQKVPADAENVEDEDKKKGFAETIGEKASGVVGGALAGFGLGRLRRDRESSPTTSLEPEAASVANREVEQDKDIASLAPGYSIQASSDEPLVEQKSLAHTPATELHDATGTPVESAPSTRAAHEPKLLLPAVPLAQAEKAAAPIVNLQHSAIFTQETEPIIPEELAKEPTTPIRSATARKTSSPVASRWGLQGLTNALSRPTTAVPAEQQLQSFNFSNVVAQEYEPEEPQMEDLPLTPMVPKRSSRRLDALYAAGENEANPDVHDSEARAIPGTDDTRPGAGFLAFAPPSLSRKRSQSLPDEQAQATAPQDAMDRAVNEPKVYGGGRGTSNIPTLVFGDSEEDIATKPYAAPTTGAPFFGASPDLSLSSESMIPVTKPLAVKKPMADEGSQTVVSGDDIDMMMRNKHNAISPAAIASAGVGALAGGALATAVNPLSQRRSVDGSVANNNDPYSARAPKRPASAGSMRSKAGLPTPPLPADHTKKIALAAQKVPPTPAAPGVMGPPIMPASAYKQQRPKTPTGHAHGNALIYARDGTTPRPTRGMGKDAPSPAGVSRRTSVSSFASELDERFNIHRAHLMYPSDVEPATDPRMIQAITQTMIGEYLWKYTRKAGRSETSNTRHRRFFWVHPYTRTLYWSENDPSVAGKDMMKSKSVAVEGVRVITDDNTSPPGLHRKSLVVVTPGREIVFTAPTGQRHETWFNALSYLLLRTGQEKEEAEDTINEEDLEEFAPGGGFSIRQSISKMTGRSQSRVSHSRLSLSSYNSRTTRTSSPQRTGDSNNLAERQAAAAQRAQTLRTPTPNEAQMGGSARSRTRDTGRLSSLTSRFKAPGSMRGSFSSARGRTMSLRGKHNGEGSDIYDASVVGDSAEDLRQVIERQEREADRLENVRACCDGKHDVGSLSRKSKHSMTSRFGHGHSHGHPRAEPITESSRPRRGE